MNGDGADVAFLLLAALLPLSYLVARRPPLRQTLIFTGAWVAIFAVGLILAGFRDRLPSLQSLLYDQAVTGSETRIGMGPDGHFWAQVALNGVERRMLVDSGATVTGISADTARAAGIEVDEGGMPVMVSTANGTVLVKRAKAGTVRVGSIATTDMTVYVSPAFGDTDVVGMNFLSRLASWRVEGSTLVLTPQEQY